MKQNTRHMVIAGGGTGGHLFPALAVAQAFVEKNTNNRVLFITTGKRLEQSILSKTVFPHQRITAQGIKGRGLKKQITAMLKLPKSIGQSARFLKDAKPDLVMGVGSYVSGPVVMAAWLKNVRIAVHEQNMTPGVTNRISALFADRIYGSFENTGKWFNPKKFRFTGNPVRKEILECIDKASEKKDQFTVLIIGGSQGAHRINEAVTQAACRIKQKDRFRFIHQTGDSDYEQVTAAYEKCNIAHEAAPFFYDMAHRYEQADLMICRAGATTVAEITALGKCVIFIPFPFAADDHQTANAKALSDKGAAELIMEKEMTGEYLAEKIEFYASRPDVLFQTALRAKAFGRPDAARMIVDDIYSHFKF